MPEKVNNFIQNVSMIQAPPRTILEVYESLPEGTRCQLINDYLIMSPAPSYEHQELSKKIFLQLNKFVERNELGEVMFAPVDVYFGLKNVYQPDIFFISQPRLNIVQEGKVKGAPDLVIEILSPGTERWDREDKKTVYEQSGVKEYWLVEPASKKTTGYQLIDNQYHQIPSSRGIIQLCLFALTITF